MKRIILATLVGLLPCYLGASETPDAFDALSEKGISELEALDSDEGYDDEEYYGDEYYEGDGYENEFRLSDPDRYDRDPRRRGRVKCVAKNRRGYRFVGFHYNSVRKARRKALRKCFHNSRRARSCYVAFCKRTRRGHIHDRYRDRWDDRYYDEDRLGRRVID